MNEIPIDFPFDKIISLEIQQICFTTNTVCLLIDGASFINLEGNFILKRNNELLIDNYEESVYLQENYFEFLNLIGLKIISIKPHKEKELEIYFENNYFLILAFNSHYESFTIKIGENKINI